MNVLPMGRLGAKHKGVGTILHYKHIFGPALFLFSIESAHGASSFWSITKIRKHVFGQ